MVLKNQSQGGQAVAAEPVNAPEAQPGPGGQDYGQIGPYTGKGADVVALVKALNANEFGGWFNPADVLAVVQIESSFIPTAYRAEPKIGDASYGLMQVLGSTSRDRGYAGDLAGLYDPETNLRVGMAQMLWSWDYLSRRLGHAPTTAQWIGSYNAGVGSALKGYVPWAYVTKWTAARALWAVRV